MFQRIRSIPSQVWIAAVVALYLYIFVRVQWRIGDEGDILNGALAVSEGRVPYRDFFDLRGPGCFYWLGLFFKIFGASWQVARLHLLLTGTCTTLLMFHLTRRVCRTSTAVLSSALVTVVSIPFWPASHHHWDSNLFALAAAATYFRWLDHGRPGWLFGCGALAGLTSSFIYQKGFYLLVSFLAVTAIARLFFRSRINVAGAALAMLAGYGAVGLLILAWFFQAGALPDFVEATIRFPLTTYADANRVPYAHHLMMHALVSLEVWRAISPALAAPAALLLMAPVFLVAALPFLVLLFAGVRLMTEPPSRWLRLPILAYGLTGLALWFSEFHRRDIMHLIYGCPLLLVALWVLWDGFDRRRLVRRLSAVAIGVPLVFLAGSQAFRAAAADQHVVTRRGPIVLPQDDAALRFLLGDAVARGDYVFVYPYYSTYYFLADVRNPTRFGEMMYGPGAKPYFDEAIAALEARQVTYILWDTLVDDAFLREWFPDHQRPPESERLMERYFQDHYEQQAILNGFRLLKRRGERP